MFETLYGFDGSDINCVNQLIIILIKPCIKVYNGILKTKKNILLMEKILNRLI